MKFPYEIPYQKDKGIQYRLFEILPGALTWTILTIPFVLAFTNVGLAAILMIDYLLLWFVKAVALNIRAIQGFNIVECKDSFNGLIDTGPIH